MRIRTVVALSVAASLGLWPAVATACDSLCTSPNFSQPYPNSFWHLRLPSNRPHR